MFKVSSSFFAFCDTTVEWILEVWDNLDFSLLAEGAQKLNKTVF